MKVLAIETSCDETAVAVIDINDDFRSNQIADNFRPKTLSSVISSQIDIHAKYGGVVPEIASRAHIENINYVVDEALEVADIKGLANIDLIGATHGPGLLGSLMVGVSYAKALAFSLGLPYIGVNHLEGHLLASFLDRDFPPKLPALVLLVSGGHSILLRMTELGSYHLIAQTQDDAAGEAFDKIARYLGLGFPGGPAVDKAAQFGDSNKIKFPRAEIKGSMDLSFSGLKTAVIRYSKNNPEVDTVDISAGFQAAVVDMLLLRVKKAIDEFRSKTLIIGGGVAANSLLRKESESLALQENIDVIIPLKKDCTDNAAMIGAVAGFRYVKEGKSEFTDSVYSTLPLSYNDT